MQAVDTSPVPTALSAHFENRRFFRSCHYENGWVRAYLSDDAIQPALAFVMEIPDSVSNSALSRIEESLYIRENIEHAHLGPVLERGRLDKRTVFWLVGIGWSRTLSDIFQEPHPNRMRLLRLMLQVGEGLEAMHDEGLCFGGLNEQGVFVGINREGLDQAFLAGCSVDAWVPELRKVKLQDLDLIRAKVLAPECAAGGNRSVSSDIYAYGALLFRALTERYPFEATTTESLLDAHLQQVVSSDIDNVPEPLWSMVLQCLRKDPHVRPESISQVINCIRDHIDGAHHVDFSSSEIASGDESSVPSSALLEGEDSEDILAVISDYLDVYSDDDSEKTLVEHTEISPPELPTAVEEQRTSDALEGKVPLFADIEQSSEEASGEIPQGLAIHIPPSQVRLARSGQVFVPTEVELEDEFTDEVLEFERDIRPLSVVVGAVPFQSELGNEPEKFEPAPLPKFELSDEEISIDAFDINIELSRIAADANIGTREETPEIHESLEDASSEVSIQDAALSLDDELVVEAYSIDDNRISDDEIVVEVVPVFEDLSEEDTIFPEEQEAQASPEPLPVMISEDPIFPVDAGPSMSAVSVAQVRIENEEVTEPLSGWSAEIEDEVTVKIVTGSLDKKTSVSRGPELWSIPLLDLLPNLVIGFVALNIILLVTNFVF